MLRNQTTWRAAGGNRPCCHRHHGAAGRGQRLVAWRLVLPRGDRRGRTACHRRPAGVCAAGVLRTAAGLLRLTATGMDPPALARQCLGARALELMIGVSRRVSVRR